MTKRIAAYLCIAALAVAGASTAQAQSISASSAAPQVGWYKQHLGHQLAASLQSPIEQIRQEALHHVNYFATHAPDDVDLSAVVPALTEIYASDENEGMRIMALTALHAIGGEGITRYLRETVQDEDSPRLRQLTLSAIADAEARTSTL